METTIKEKEIEELEETCLRLHCYLKRLWEENGGFNLLHRKIEQKTRIRFSKDGKARIQLNNYREYCFYLGKLYSYLYVLHDICKVSEVYTLIVRLRGVQFDDRGAKTYETKYVSEIDKVGP